MCVIVMYKLSVGYAKFFCDFFASTASFRQNLAEFSAKPAAEFLKNSAELLANSADNSVNSAEFRMSKNFLFLSHISCISAEFFRFSPIFFKFFEMARFFLPHRTL
jgi:hypothetical protein